MEKYAVTTELSWQWTKYGLICWMQAIMSATKLAAHAVVLMCTLRIHVLWNRNANGVVNKRWLHMVCLQMK